MSEVLKIAIIVAVDLLIVALVIFLVRKRFRKIEVLDGDGMVYNWHEDHICGEWVEADSLHKDSPCVLRIDDESVAEYGAGEPLKSDYRINHNTIFEAEFPGSAELLVGRELMYEKLVYHTQTLGDTTIPIISATLMEYDGRGLICVNEYVRREDLDLIPEGFRSDFCTTLNSVEPVSTVREPFNRKKAFLFRRDRVIAGGSCEVKISDNSVLEFYEETDYPDNGEVGVADHGADLYFVGCRQGESDVCVTTYLFNGEEESSNSFRLRVDENLVVSRVDG